MNESLHDVSAPSAAAPAPELERSPCPNGCAPSDEILFEGKDRLHGVPGVFGVARCRSCGLMRTDPRPSPASMGAFYPDDYHVYGAVPVRGGPPPHRGTLRRLGKKLVQFQADDLPVEPPGTLLEVGCASGHYLAALERLGWDVEGIEFSASASAAATEAGFVVHNGPLESVEGPTRQFDVVVMRMVLEHLHDPVAGLRRLHAWTKPGGWLMVTVPDAGCFEMSLFKDAWYALDLPRHLYHFTPETIGSVLERGGWTLDRVMHQRDVANVVASLGYAVSDRIQIPGVVDRLVRFPQTQSWERFALYPLAATLAAFGQTGRMTVWARRAD